MKKFIIENWFKLAIIILLVVIIYYLSQIADGIVIYNHPIEEKYLK